MSAIRILLIGQDMALADRLVDLLQARTDLKVIAIAVTGALGLLWAQSLRPEVVLVDLDVHEGEELKTICGLRASLPIAGIIALALNDQSRRRKEALTAGADNFVSKHHLGDDLVPTIQQVVQVRALP
jgi:DNA-binding NarL/FixJ family response regulator